VLNPALFGTSARVYITRNAAESSYHALQLQYRRRMQRGVQVLASYTLSSSRDNVSDESLIGSPVGGPPGFPIDPKGEFGPSDFDARHNVVGSVTWSLPSPRAGMARAVLGGWGLDAIGRYHSATPLTVIVATTDPLNTGVTVRRRAIRAGVDPGSTTRRHRAGDGSTPRVFGASLDARATSRAPVARLPLRQIDLSVCREPALPGQARLQLRIDAFNVLNLPNFSDPVVSFTGSPFARRRHTSSQLGTTSQSVGFNRRTRWGALMQASLRLFDATTSGRRDAGCIARCTAAACDGGYRYRSLARRVLSGRRPPAGAAREERGAAAVGARLRGGLHDAGRHQAGERGLRVVADRPGGTRHR
jgi:hypothetical protein